MKKKITSKYLQGKAILNIVLLYNVFIKCVKEEINSNFTLKEIPFLSAQKSRSIRVMPLSSVIVTPSVKREKRSFSVGCSRVLNPERKCEYQ